MAKNQSAQITSTSGNGGQTNPMPKAVLNFEQWWAQYSAKKNLNPALKQALKSHMQARGFYQKSQWAAGAADFGMKA